MRGGGRNREIQGLQAKAAANGGEGTARQQARMQYLQNHQQAGRRPQGPQTGGPLMEAMGPGGQEAIRTQQPYQGGASNGGTTWDGPMRAMDGGDVNSAGRPIMKQGGSYGDYQAAYGAANDAMQRSQGGQPILDQFGRPRDLHQDAQRLKNDPGFARPGMAPPMQRPTPMQNDAGFQQQLDPAQMERMKLGMQAPRTMGQNPNTIAGQGVGAGRFQTDGMRAPEARNPTGNQFMGGGDPNMNRFSKFGSFVPPARNVEGNQVRGGGSPGLSRRRVDTNRGPAAGVLAPPPNRMR